MRTIPFFHRTLHLSRLRPLWPRCASSDRRSLSYNDKRLQFQSEIDALPEHKASLRLLSFLQHHSNNNNNNSIDNNWNGAAITAPQPTRPYKYEMNARQFRTCLDAALATFALHVESRVASLLGYGFYTIGPCGEESLASAACVLQPEDSLALHYRHLSINLTRQLLLQQAPNNGLEQLLLDRARGYTVSRHDPVTGGVHCSIGSDPAMYANRDGGDFVVTSTLASQCPAAVGRGLAYSLSPRKKERPISVVTVGDGSVHNSHFWSAFHLARHARHRNIKCPVLFGISDNGLSISYKTGGYVDTLFGHDPLIPCFRVNGNDMMDVYSQTRVAADYCRTKQAPAVVLYSNLVRRFGHAATDRQSAYLHPNDIQEMADCTVLESAVKQAVEVFSVTTYPEIRDRWLAIQQMTRSSFATASQEEKVTRQEMLSRVAQPLAVPQMTRSSFAKASQQEKFTRQAMLSRVAQQRGKSVSRPKWDSVRSTETGASTGNREVMRKLMTRVIAETMERNESVVYLGEDVRHVRRIVAVSFCCCFGKTHQLDKYSKGRLLCGFGRIT